MYKYNALKFKWEMKHFHLQNKKKKFIISRAKLFSWFKYQYMYKNKSSFPHLRTLEINTAL